MNTKSKVVIIASASVAVIAIIIAVAVFFFSANASRPASVGLDRGAALESSSAEGTSYETVVNPEGSIAVLPPMSGKNWEGVAVSTPSILIDLPPGWETTENTFSSEPFEKGKDAIATFKNSNDLSLTLAVEVGYDGYGTSSEVMSYKVLAPTHLEDIVLVEYKTPKRWDDYSETKHLYHLTEQEQIDNYTTNSKGYGCFGGIAFFGDGGTMTIRLERGKSSSHELMSIEDLHLTNEEADEICGIVSSMRPA